VQPAFLHCILSSRFNLLCRGALGNCVITGDFEVQALEDTLAAFCK
jgi:hypothetical protein